MDADERTLRIAEDLHVLRAAWGMDMGIRQLHSNTEAGRPVLCECRTADGDKDDS